MANSKVGLLTRGSDARAAASVGSRQMQPERRGANGGKGGTVDAGFDDVSGVFQSKLRIEARFEQTRTTWSSDIAALPDDSEELLGYGSGRNADLQLMIRVAGGEAEAQRQVIRRLLRRVECLCRAALRSAEDAVEASRLTIAEILNSAPTFQGESCLEHWSDRITVRAALRVATSESRSHRTPTDSERHTSVLAGDRALLVRGCLNSLSNQERMIVVMRHTLNYSIDDIAEVTGFSANAVTELLLHARGLMRRVCRDENFPVDSSRSKAET